MPRTEVYQLRLTPEEKAELAKQAESKGQSIAQMIRSTFGISPKSIQKRAKFEELLKSKEVPIEKLAETQQWAEVQRHDEAIARVVNGELANELKECDLIQKLYAGGMTKRQATIEAKRRLGEDR